VRLGNQHVENTGCRFGSKAVEDTRQNCGVQIVSVKTCESEVLGHSLDLDHGQVVATTSRISVKAGTGFPAPAPFVSPAARFNSSPAKLLPPLSAPATTRIGKSRVGTKLGTVENGVFKPRGQYR